MHIAGKILIWVVVALVALVAIPLTAKLYDVRNSWARAVDTLSEANQKRAAEIEARQTELRSLQTRYNEVMRGWGPYWYPVQATVSPDGTVTLNNLGAAQGLGKTAPPAGADAAAPAGTDARPAVYLFAVDQNGGSKYVGSFNIANLAPNQATLTPTWLIRPDEPQQWQAAAWRVRAGIPTGEKERIAGLRTSLVNAGRTLNDKLRHLQVEQQAVQDAQAILASRKAELQGDPADPQIEGLISRIAQAEDARNQELAELDRLRRQVQAVYEQRRTLEQQVKAYLQPTAN